MAFCGKNTKIGRKVELNILIKKPSVANLNVLAFTYL